MLINNFALVHDSLSEVAMRIGKIHQANRSFYGNQALSKRSKKKAVIQAFDTDIQIRIVSKVSACNGTVQNNPSRVVVA